MSTLLDELEVLQKRKDAEAGIYLNNKPLTQQVDLLEVGQVLSVTKHEKWLGNDSEIKMRIELKLVGDIYE